MYASSAPGVRADILRTLRASRPVTKHNGTHSRKHNHVEQVVRLDLIFRVLRIVSLCYSAPHTTCISIIAHTVTVERPYREISRPRVGCDISYPTLSFFDIYARCVLPPTSVLKGTRMGLDKDPVLPGGPADYTCAVREE